MGAPPEHFYTQSGVIPWRRNKDGELRILLITSRSGKKWIIPKGVVEDDLTPAESAAKEAFEEAGIYGTVTEPSVGSYSYAKWEGTCTVEVFLMEVTEELDDWPESTRERKWRKVEKAVEILGEVVGGVVLAGIAELA